MVPAFGWVAGKGLGCLADVWVGGLAGLRLGTSFGGASFILGFGIPLTATTCGWCDMARCCGP